MVSKNLTPTSKPVVHNVEDDILDHHPLSIQIQCRTNHGDGVQTQTKVKELQDSSKLRDQSRCGDSQQSSNDVVSFRAHPSSPGTRIQRSAKNDFKNPETRLFKCEICKKCFTTRHGLYIHFGKARDTPHFPCKEKFHNELDPHKNQCLRVFSSAENLKKHRKEQAMDGNRLHHNPKHDFPNLVYVNRIKLFEFQFDLIP